MPDKLESKSDQSDSNTTYVVSRETTESTGQVKKSSQSQKDVKIISSDSRNSAQSSDTRYFQSATSTHHENSPTETKREIRNFLNEIDGEFHAAYNENYGQNATNGQENIVNTERIVKTYENGGTYVNGNRNVQYETSNVVQTSSQSGKNAKNSSNKNSKTQTTSGKKFTRKDGDNVRLVGGKIVKTSNLKDSKSKITTQSTSSQNANTSYQSQDVSESQQYYRTDASDQFYDDYQISDNIVQSSSYNDSRTNYVDGGINDSTLATYRDLSSGSAANDSQIYHNFIDSGISSTIEETILAKVEREVVDIVNVQESSTFNQTDYSNYTINDNSISSTFVDSNIRNDSAYDTMNYSNNFTSINDSLISNTNVIVDERMVQGISDMRQTYDIDQRNISDYRQSYDYDQRNISDIRQTYDYDQTNISDIRQSYDYDQRMLQNVSDSRQTFGIDQTIESIPNIRQTFDNSDLSRSYVIDKSSSNTNIFIDERVVEEISRNTFVDERVIQEVSDIRQSSSFDNVDYRNYTTLDQSSLSNTNAFINDRVIQETSNVGYIDERVIQETSNVNTFVNEVVNKNTVVDERYVQDISNIRESSYDNVDYTSNFTAVDESSFNRTDVYVDERVIQEKATIERTDERISQRNVAKTRKDTQTKAHKEQCICEICTCGWVWYLPLPIFNF